MLLSRRIPLLVPVFYSQVILWAVVWGTFPFKESIWLLGDLISFCESFCVIVAIIILLIRILSNFTFNFFLFGDILNINIGSKSSKLFIRHWSLSVILVFFKSLISLTHIPEQVNNSFIVLWRLVNMQLELNLLEELICFKRNNYFFPLCSWWATHRHYNRCFSKGNFLCLFNPSP